jgi:hypothetical protein
MQTGEAEDLKASNTLPTPTPAAKKIKDANKPFLVHQRWLKKREAEKLEMSAANANSQNDPVKGSGEKVKKTLKTPTGSSAVVSTFKWLALALLTSAFLSRSVTDTWLWGYKGKYSNPQAVSLL